LDVPGQRFGRWLPALAWAGVISAFSSGWFTGERTRALLVPVLGALLPWIGPETLLAVHSALRKLGHFLEYLVLSVLLYRALRTGSRWEMRAALLALAIAGVYGVVDEVHQSFVPGRTAAATDSLIDFSGAVAGQALVAWRFAARANLARRRRVL
jgi:VanZ family protein